MDLEPHGEIGDHMIKVQPSDTRWRFLVDRIESKIATDYTRRYDQDGNGIVERSEFSDSTDIFEQIDQNQNSRLELAEVKRYVDLLRQHERIRNLDATEQPVEPKKERHFSVSPYEKLTESVRDYFSEEIRNLDKDGNGFLETDELVGNLEELSLMDRDRNNLISPREWTEGFVENHTDIQMALEAYRFSHGTFQSGGGIIRMTV